MGNGEAAGICLCHEAVQDWGQADYQTVIDSGMGGNNHRVGYERVRRGHHYRSHVSS